MIIHSRFRGIKTPTDDWQPQPPIQGKHCLSADGGILP